VSPCHVLVSFGKVARRLVNGEPEILEGYIPKLRVIDVLLKIEREPRTIIGYTAPSKRVVEVITEDQLDRAPRQYIEDAAIGTRRSGNRSKAESCPVAIGSRHVPLERQGEPHRWGTWLGCNAVTEMPVCLANMRMATHPLPADCQFAECSDGKV
jgi:hypothetical protein